MTELHESVEEFERAVRSREAGRDGHAAARAAAVSVRRHVETHFDARRNGRRVLDALMRPAF